MGNASLDGRTFRIDPMSVRWGFRPKARDFKTVGGKVVQITGIIWEDMTVIGSFGRGGPEEQAQFLVRMKALGDRHVAAGSSPGSLKPVRFLYPGKGWDFWVYLVDYKEPGQVSSVRLALDNFAPRWQLRLHIVSDNAGLDRVATDAYIARLAQGLGWKHTKWNGPMTFDDVQAQLGGMSIEQYLASYYGVGDVPMGNMEAP